MGNLKVPLLFFLICALLTIGLIYSYSLQLKKFDWPETRATIDSAWYYKGTNDAYSFYIDYSYQVDAQNFNGSDIAIDKDGERLEDVALYSGELYENLDFINSQKSIMIRYNPDNPSDSISQAYTSTWLIIFSVFTGLCALLGFAGMVTALRGTNKSTEQGKQEAAEMMKKIRQKMSGDE
ncbi:MAG: DUF3592 domain-containing protein [Bacteroidota bacterium]